MQHGHALMILYLVAGGALASSPLDWGAPAPAEEIARADETVEAAFGPELFASSVELASSGLINSDGELAGYFVCYRYFPVAATGSYAVVCVERRLGEEYTGLEGRPFPRCAVVPGPCDVHVTAAEALEIARAAGYAVPAESTGIRLSWSRTTGELGWTIYEDGDENRCGRAGKSVLVSAVTGAVLQSQDID